MLKVGPHVTKAKNPDQMRRQAEASGWGAIQTFWGNPRSLSLGPCDGDLPGNELASGHPLEWVLHSAYLATAHPKDVISGGSSEYLRRLLGYGAAAGCHSVVVHVGATKGKSAEAVQWGVRQFLEGNKLPDHVEGLKGPLLLVENVAAKYEFNQDLPRFAETFRPYRGLVGWCLDCAHANGAGVPIDAVVAAVEGDDPPGVIHINYPGSTLGSGRDRHGWRYKAGEFEELLELESGYTAGFDRVVQLAASRGIPCIVEGGSTPGDSVLEIAKLREIAAG